MKKNNVLMDIKTAKKRFYYKIYSIYKKIQFYICNMNKINKL